MAVFDATAWALVHYLMFADKGAFSSKVNRFSRLLYDGKDPDAAVREAFGDMQPYYDGMRAYVERSLFAYSQIPVSLDTRPEAYAVRALAPAEAAVLRGQLLVGHEPAGRGPGRGRGSGQGDPSLPGPWRSKPTCSTGRTATKRRPPTPGQPRRGRSGRTSTTGWPSSSGPRMPTRRSRSGLRRASRKRARSTPRARTRSLYLPSCGPTSDNRKRRWPWPRRRSISSPPRGITGSCWRGFTGNCRGRRRPGRGSARPPGRGQRHRNGRMPRSSWISSLAPPVRRRPRPPRAVLGRSFGKGPGTLADVCRGGDKADCAHLRSIRREASAPGDRARRGPRSRPVQGGRRRRLHRLGHRARVRVAARSDREGPAASASHLRSRNEDACAS